MSLRTAAALALAALAAACSGRSDPAPVVFRGSDPSGGATASRALAPLPPAAPGAVAEAPLGTATPVGADSSGMIDYGGYRAIVARQGDTVESMAARAGLAPSALAAYNGLPAQHVPRAGDELILPPDAGPAPAAIATLPAAEPAPRPEPPAAVAAVAPQAPPPTAGAVRLDLDRIEAEVAAPPVAAVEPPSESAALSELPPPAPVAAPSVPAPAPARATAFAAPVDGRIVRGYGESAGGGKSDGVDFAAPMGAPVRASADGEVALVSQSLGGLGTIVLIRHENQLLTVYGRVDGVTVKRGDKVRRGDVIGAVAPGADGREPSLHFEVRRGAESVDPGEFLG